MFSRKSSDTFFRLRSAYLVALGLIALTILAEQWLVGNFLADQKNDAEIINVAGRQRMLSQRIVKQLTFARPGVDALVDNWQLRHTWLKEQLAGSPVAVRLETLDPIVENFVAGTTAQTDSLSELFLLEMDAIVNDISITAAGKVGLLQQAKRWLGGLTLGILLLELIFIFRPITRFISRQFQQLDAERQAQEIARLAAEEAVEQREQSLRELQGLNEAIDEAVLFATLHRDGSPAYLSAQLAKLIGWRSDGTRRLLVQYLHRDTARQEALQAILMGARASNWRGEWEIEDTSGKTRWLNVTIVPARRTREGAELFLLASDITHHKVDRAALESLNQERMAEQLQLSRQRSRQVVNAQEQERLRIARDLHDGIGQKLTALKMGLESLKPASLEEQTHRVVALRELAREIILSIRVATFNLSPPELSDYGLTAGLEKLCRELSRLTGQRILFERNGFSGRFSAIREISVFRIVQEAINNAIKYADADFILVSISSGDQLFSITVTDNGQGFNADREEPGEGTGLGLRNMQSRIEDIDGRLFVHSDPDTGTKVTINLPLLEEEE